MAIALPALLKLANFPKEDIDKLVENIDYLTDEEKLKLSDTSWYLISQKYFLNLELQRMKILDEIKQGKRKYNPNDFEEVKARLISDLTNKLRETTTQESIEEVRTQLEKYKTKPLVQDKTSSSPPPQKEQI